MSFVARNNRVHRMPLRRQTWRMGAIVAGLAVLPAAAGQADTPLLSRCHYRAQPDTVRALPRAMREISSLRILAILGMFGV